MPDWLKNPIKVDLLLEREWDAICPVCSDVYKQEPGHGPFRIFMHGALEVKQPVCPKCVDVQPCTNNWQGIHGEVIDLADWATGSYGAIPADSMPEDWDLHSCAVPLTQLGFCRECYLWMRWDVPTQRWRDLNLLPVAERYWLVLPELEQSDAPVPADAPRP